MRTSTLCACLVAGSLLAFSLNSQAIVMVGGGGGSGPSCGGAAASEGIIWPPNHQMVPETIIGVTDPFDHPVAIAITGIQQDEPVETAGSGNTEPDGSGVGTAIAYVRAERAGPGTGRIYFISFTATDWAGGQCTGMVQVFVPHDQGQGFLPIDTGQRYDSTQVID